MQVLEIKALIGYFDLDPNRAMSLVLLAFAAQPGRRAYLQLFELFTNTATEQTLGFLFQHRAGPGGETPENLFTVAVALIQVSGCCGATRRACCFDSTLHALPRTPTARAPCYGSPAGLRARCTVKTAQAAHRACDDLRTAAGSSGGTSSLGQSHSDKIYGPESEARKRNLGAARKARLR